MRHINTLSDAGGVLEKNYPSHLYKFYEVKNFLPRVLNGESLKFSCPFEFNDPFESRACYHIEVSEEGREYIKRMVRQRFSNPSKRIAITKRLMNRFKEPQALDDDLAIERIIRSVGVCCFSSVRDSILMWSHYAKEHKGICIGFHANASHFKLAWEVIYQDEFPVVMRPKDSNEQVLRKTLLTKSSCWSYENEWRIIKRTMTDQEKMARLNKAKFSPEESILLQDENGPGEYRFPKKSIAEICLGARIEKNQKDFVISAIREANLDIPIYQAQRNPKLYQLEFAQIN